jgi:3-hydroxyisobutyrate dehydrogenase-like beta-hydroxyacid dehydrogenase
MHVAFLGMGIMGAPMAANLAKAGHKVTTWNRSAGKNPPDTKAAPTAREAVDGAEVVWICVSDTKAVEDVLFGPQGIADVLKPGTIVADSSTILPSASQRFAERLEAKAVHFVDVPVTGSKVAAESGQLIFIAGGEEAVLLRLKPLLEAMGKKTVRVGEQGKGLAAKLAMNLNIGLIYEGLAEGMVLARKLGVDPEKLGELIMAAMIRSGVAEYKLPAIFKRDFSPNFPLRLMHKDIHLMLEAANEAGVKLPGTETIEKIYAESAKAGHANDDYAATITTLEKMAGLN